MTAQETVLLGVASDVAAPGVVLKCRSHDEAGVHRCVWTVGGFRFGAVTRSTAE
jgi:hypothetical protein